MRSRLLLIALALCLGACDSSDPPNTAPSGQPDTYTTPAATRLTVTAEAGVIANDEDPEDDPLHAELYTTTSNGLLALEPHGGFEYMPNAGFAGADTFTYRANDGKDVSQPILVTINVEHSTSDPPSGGGGNTPPTTSDGTWETAEDTPLALHLKGRDEDGDTLTFRILTHPGHGTLSEFEPSTGRVTYTPDQNFFGADAFTFEVSDAQATATGTATITVTPVNDPPSAMLHAAPITGEAPLTVELDGSASRDVEGPIGTYAWTIGDVMHGEDVTTTHTFTEPGSYSVTLTVTDAEGLTDTARTTITATPSAPTLQAAHRARERSERYGYSVAVDGDTAVVGAPEAEGNGWFRGGLIYIYEREADPGGTWELRRVLHAPVGAGGLFGWAVAISGDTIAVGARGAGAVFILSRHQGGENHWGQVQRIERTDPNFGSELALDGDDLVIGSPYTSDAGAYSGAAYVYQRPPGVLDGWTLAKKVAPRDSAAGDRFGTAVAIYGDRVVIGARGNGGGAYIFSRDHGGTNNWGEVTRLQANDDTPAAVFGGAVAIHDDHVIVGALGTDESRGRAYVFSYDAGEWAQTAVLRPERQNEDDRFGGSVAIWKDKAVVGAYMDDEALGNAGAAHVYHRTSNADGLDIWTEYAKLLPTPGTGGDMFGTSVATSGAHIIVGAERHDGRGGSFIFQD